MKYFILIAALALASCGNTVPKEQFVKVTAEPLPRPALNLPPIDQLSPRPVRWTVITPANADAVFAQIEADGGVPSVFALTEEGYKSLVLNDNDTMKVILQQQAVINGYRKYYIQADGIIYEYNQQIAQTDYWTKTFPNGTPRPTSE